MSAATPAMLSLELGVDQKRIRDVLRDAYGTLRLGTTRWELDDQQVALVRSRFVRMPLDHSKWVLEVGDRVPRRLIHQQYGGNQRRGIVPLRTASDILVFTNPRSNARHGYHDFEGLQPDGSFAYTGEGPSGAQAFTGGNRALLFAADQGKTIRVFRSESPYATYVGAFTTGDPPCEIVEMGGADGEMRQGILFTLVPLNANTGLLDPSPATSRMLKPQIARWSPPDASDVVIPPLPSATPPGDRVVSRVEFQLQSDFGLWLSARGTPPSRLRIPVGGVIIEPDMYVDAEGWVVEAKKSTAREYVRMAIGQVLDYTHKAQKNYENATPMILLPGRVESDLQELTTHLGIAVACRDGSSFELTHP